MTRTWADNRETINQLWPASTFTEEERRLWHDDLSGLDQQTLYDAIRNVKRQYDSVYPQLKWVLDAYRVLNRTRQVALGKRGSPREEKVPITISAEDDRRISKEIIEWIDEAIPSDYRTIVDAIFAPESFNKTSSITAFRLVDYARRRLLGEEPKFSRVDHDGDLKPIPIAPPSPEEITA